MRKKIAVRGGWLKPALRSLAISSFIKISCCTTLHFRFFQLYEYDWVQPRIAPGSICEDKIRFKPCGLNISLAGKARSVCFPPHYNGVLILATDIDRFLQDGVVGENRCRYHISIHISGGVKVVVKYMTEYCKRWKSHFTMNLLTSANVPIQYRCQKAATFVPL